MLTTRRQRRRVTRLLLVAHPPESQQVGAESVRAHRRRLDQDPWRAPPYDTGSVLKPSVAAR